MKTKSVIFAVAAVAVVVLALSVWYFLPTGLLRGVEPSEIASVSVFDGNTGKGFEISDPGVIAEIAENLKSASLKKDGVSLGRKGYLFRLTFYDASGRQLDRFIVNGAESVRKDPFFYRSASPLCCDRLSELEEIYG